VSIAPFLSRLQLPQPYDLVFVIGLLILLVATLVALVFRRLQRQYVNEREGRIAAEHALTRASELESLARSLSRAQTTVDVVNVSLSMLRAATGADAGAVALVSADGSRLEVVQAIGYSDGPAVMRYRVPLTAKTVLTQAVQRRVPAVIPTRPAGQIDAPDVTDEPTLEGEAAMVLPLLRSGHAIGAVALNFPQPRAENIDEPSPFLMSAVQLTVQALDRAARYERAENARQDLEAYRARAEHELLERERAEQAFRESEARYRVLAARTSRLYTLSAGLSEAITLEAVAKAVVRHGKVVAGAPAGSVAMLIDGGAQFETLYAEDYPRQLMEAWRRFPAEPGLCSTVVVETRQPVLLGSFEEWQQRFPRSASMSADGGYASVAVLPLLVESAAIGVLSFHFTAPLNFDAEYEALLTSIAHHAAQAIDRARLYEAAQHARADAEAANKSKDEFLSVVSHELRTPLTAVLGWAGMLRARMLDPDRAARAVEAIYSNATRQVRLIDELLDVSRIIAGRAPLDLQEMDLGQTIRGAVEAILPAAVEKKLDVRIAPLPENLRVVADPHRLQQVFANLLGNAIKFTPPGGRISIDACTSEGFVDVRVSDTGRGIDRDFLPHVFERFRQGDSSATRSAGGLGLGLFITRRLVEAHGGRVGVDSEGAGRGSTFTVSLPSPVMNIAPALEAGGAVTAPEADSRPNWPSLTGVRVLLVDDEADALEAMASILEVCGARVLPASSGDEAMDILSRDDGGIDVMLSDIAMPDTDGYTLIRRVRTQLQPRLAALPAAAITACAGADERQRALSEGFQDHLAKPVTPESLVRAVASLAVGHRGVL